MELYIFDRDFNFKGIFEGYYSLRWIRRYSKCGGFELHCSLTSETLNLLKKGNIIWKKDDLEAGYIEYRNLTQDEEGKEILVIKGRFLTGYIGRRIIWGIENLNTISELGIRELINKNCINPTNIDRKIDSLILGELKNYTEKLNYQVSYKNLLEEIESIVNVSELGIRTLFDLENKQMIFDIYKGLDRTAGQSKNAPAIFSREFENVLEQEYTDSLNNYKNVGLIAGEGEGTARQLAVVGQGIGLKRYETFIDARDLQKETMTVEEYEAKLKDRGITKLAEYKEIETFESKIDVRSNLVYKKDFNLGDLVTCTSKEWGITVDTRITEIEEVYEEDGFNVNVVFGNNIPTLIDVIKREVK